MRTVVALIIWWYASTAAVHYGGIWDSRAYPRQGVVVLNNGERITGSLTRDWENNWVMDDTEGGRHEFKDYRVMSIPFPQAGIGAGVFRGWRITLPVTSVSTLFLIYLLFRTLPGRKHNAVT